MTRQIVYRLEANGRGIYCRGWMRDQFGYDMGYDCGGRHPSLVDDAGFRHFDYYDRIRDVCRSLGCQVDESRFGFGSWEQFDRWFTKAERKMLADKGVTLVRLHVKPEGVIVGDRQAVYNTGKVIKREELSLEHARPPRKPVGAR